MLASPLSSSWPAWRPVQNASPFPEEGDLARRVCLQRVAATSDQSVGRGSHAEQRNPAPHTELVVPSSRTLNGHVTDRGPSNGWLSRKARPVTCTGDGSLSGDHGGPAVTPATGQIPFGKVRRSRPVNVRCISTKCAALELAWRQSASAPGTDDPLVRGPEGAGVLVRWASAVRHCRAPSATPYLRPSMSSGCGRFRPALGVR